jgi:hypothetical protein
MFEQKYSEAPGGIFVLETRYKKGGCLLLHAIRRTILVESYEVKLKVQLRSRIFIDASAAVKSLTEGKRRKPNFATEESRKDQSRPWNDSRKTKDNRPAQSYSSR